MDENSMGLTPYEKYQLQWLIDHGHSLSDLINQLDEYRKNADENNEMSIREIFSEWEFDIGFNGEIYVCEDEYYDNDYLEDEE